jgi:hypothetical protein
MPLGILGEQFSGGIEMRVLTNTGKDVENFAPMRFGVLDAIRSQDRQSIMRGKIDKLPVDAFFPAQKMALNFNKDIFVTESIDQQLRAIGEALGSAGC